MAKKKAGRPGTNDSGVPQGSAASDTGAVAPDADVVPAPAQMGQDSPVPVPEPPERRRPKWIMVAALSIGIVIAGYLVYGHLQLTYGTKTFESLCNISETINCDTVNTSDYSDLFGLPIALYAIPTYLVLMYLVLRSLGQRGDGEAAPLSFIVGISGLTVLASLGLAYLSIFEVQAVCLFCISLYLVNLTTFGLSWYASRRSLGANLRELFGWLARRPVLAIEAAAVLILSLGVSLGAEQYLKGKMLQETQAAVNQQAAANPVKAGEGPLVDADDAVYGSADAAVTVVEFADFQCGYCKRMSYTLKALKDQYHDRVRFVFKNFPMSPKCNNAVKNDKHPYACDAARAGVCANRMGRFWEFHDLTFKNQRNLKVEDLVNYGELVGMDAGQFRQCMSDQSVNSVIAADVDASRPYEITGTPRIFINGQQFRGIVPKEVLENALLKALGEGAKAAGDASDDAGAVAALDPSQSPEMIEVKLADRSFLIDTFEASRGPRGEAVSAPDKAPYNKTSWYDAQTACSAAGKRVCTQEEWVSACQGAPAVDDNRNGKLGDDLIEGNEFSYSDFYQDGACNDKQDDKTGKVAFTGAFNRCHTPSGIFDLNGNVQEWVGANDQTAVLMGGNFYGGEKASCFQVQDTSGAGFANKATGFRCCTDR